MVHYALKKSTGKSAPAAFRFYGPLRAAPFSLNCLGTKYNPGGAAFFQCRRQQQTADCAGGKLPQRYLQRIDPIERPAEFEQNKSEFPANRRRIEKDRRQRRQSRQSLQTDTSQRPG